MTRLRLRLLKMSLPLYLVLSLAVDSRRCHSQSKHISHCRGTDTSRYLAEYFSGTGDTSAFLPGHIFDHLHYPSITCMNKCHFASDFRHLLDISNKIIGESKLGLEINYKCENFYAFWPFIYITTAFWEPENANF